MSKLINSELPKGFSRRGRGFTLIELLITIAIMGVMIVLFIPQIDKALNHNNLANDAQLISSQIESAHLMSSASQQADDGQGGYAVYLPAGSGKTFYIVRVRNSSSGSCLIDNYYMGKTPPNECVVSTTNMSTGVNFVTANASQGFLIVFTVPTQRVSAVSYSSGSPSLIRPTGWGNVITLNQDGYRIKAHLSINTLTAAVSVTYN